MKDHSTYLQQEVKEAHTCFSPAIATPLIALKIRLIRIMKRSLMPVALVTLVSCSSIPPVGSARLTYDHGVPVIIQTVEVTATVVAIDHAKRNATLGGPYGFGRLFTVKVGKGAIDLAHVPPGDVVAVTMTQKVFVTLPDEGVLSKNRGAAGVAPGSGGRASDAQAEEMLSSPTKVTAVYVERGTAILQFEDGSTRVVIPHADDVGRLQVGDEVDYTVTDMNAIWIEKLR
jgi:hypothetical protein